MCLLFAVLHSIQFVWYQLFTGSSDCFPSSKRSVAIARDERRGDSGASSSRPRANTPRETGRSRGEVPVDETRSA